MNVFGGCCSPSLSTVDWAALPLSLIHIFYWNPELRLDAEGKATIEYYTPDSTAPEDIIIAVSYTHLAVYKRQAKIRDRINSRNQNH